MRKHGQHGAASAWVVLLCAASLVGGCTGEGGGTAADASDESATGPDAATDALYDGESGPTDRDVGYAETGLPETGFADGGVADTGAADSGAADSGVAEAGVPETSLADSGVAETGATDSAADSGAADSGGANSGMPETGAADGAADAGWDATPLDASNDASDEGQACRDRCPPSEKLCGGQCVSQTDPRFGCGPDLCAASTPHAVPACTATGALAIASCEPGWRDCNGDPSDGCEADLSSAATCQSCGTRCGGTTPLCAAAGCVAQCVPPDTDCTDRCVNLESSPVACGGCGRACQASNAFSTCTGGSCGKQCWNGYAGCSATSCNDLQSDPTACGACGHSCPVPSNGTATCTAGQCGVQCQSGWTLCTNTCAALQVDVMNCGACGQACSAKQVCTGGRCVDPATIWLASGQTAPQDLAVDADYVYWDDPTAGTVSRVSKGGGAVTLIAQNQAKPTGLRLDDQYAYWTNNLGGAVVRAPKDGSALPTVVLAKSTLFAIDATYLYYNAGASLGSSTSLAKTPKAGGGPSTPFGARSFTPASDLTTDGEALYFYDLYAVTYYRVDFATGAASVLAVEGNFASLGHPFALDSTYIYYGVQLLGGRGYIAYAPKNHSGSTERLNLNNVGADSIAANECSFSWSTGAEIQTATRGDAVAETINVPATDVAMDVTSIFYVSGGSIGKVPVP